MAPAAKSGIAIWSSLGNGYGIPKYSLKYFKRLQETSRANSPSASLSLVVQILINVPSGVNLSIQLNSPMMKASK